ncbi:MAG: hypothetical protein IJC27_04195 [Lentisphaeria bacterium]|nr:hypothetical protein [Lentisphaeria bacterium]
MKRFFSALLLFFAAALPAEEINMLKDPSVSVPEGKEWFLSTTTREVFELEKDPSTGYIYLASTGADYSGYLCQFVKVKPNYRYRFDVQLRHLNGRALLWIKAFDKNRKILHYDRRKYLISSADNPLVPDFVSTGALQGSGSTDWRTVSLEVDTVKAANDTEEIAYLRVGSGPYFSVAKLWYRHFSFVELGPVENSSKGDDK